MPVGQSTDLPQTFERRAYIRYSRALDVVWAILGLASREITSGQLFDLSATGVGLLLDRSFPVGSTLMVRLPTVTHGWASHLIRVKRCKALDPKIFEVGCAFVKPLSAAQVQALLG